MPHSVAKLQLSSRRVRLIAALLASLSMLGPFSIDTYLPAFPAMAQAFAVHKEIIQQTLTAYLIPFGLMMLWHGALSDAWGRRRVILLGLVVYVLASLLCALATSLDVLLAGRALQGMSAGAGMVVGRAMVRDLYDGPAAQRLMAQISLMFALGPAIAPILGGWLQTAFGWQGVFWFLVLVASLLWLLVGALLPETWPPERRQSLAPGRLWQAYRGVLVNRHFLRLALALGLNFNGMFLYVLSAPALLIDHLGLTPREFAWLFVPCVAGMMCGSYLSGRLAGRISPRRTIILGYVLMAVAASSNVLLNLWLPAAVPWTLLPLPLYTTGMALTVPSLQLLALDLFPRQRGLASSCQGFIQTATSAFSAAVLAPLLWVEPLYLALGMWFSMAAGWWVLRQQQ